MDARMPDGKPSTLAEEEVRDYADESELLFQNGLKTGLMTRTNGALWIEGHLGFPRATAHRRSTRSAMDYRPWHNIGKGPSAKLSYEDIR